MLFNMIYTIKYVIYHTKKICYIICYIKIKYVIYHGIKKKWYIPWYAIYHGMRRCCRRRRCGGGGPGHLQEPARLLLPQPCGPAGPARPQLSDLPCPPRRPAPYRGPQLEP